MAGEIAILGWGSLLWTGDFTTPDEENPKGSSIAGMPNGGPTGRR